MTDQPVSFSVLVVDDEPANIDILKDILQPFYKVRVAPSGQVALKVIERTPPDLILLDVMMPEMDGLEVCKRLKSQPDYASIPVIFVTALGQGEDEERGFAVGAVDYIAKPIVPALVLARVKTHLALSHQQKMTEQEVQQRTRALQESQLSAINMLATAGHYNDTDTGVHIWRMAAYAKALALRLHWPVEKAELLGQAATMHDTGKIGIPDSILKAPRRLTDEEMSIMRQHAQIGYDILSQSHSPLFDLAAEVAWCHHEKWDGSGYPRKLQGTDIPESARIVALADVFDALTMERPYKKAWSCEAAFDHIRSEAGSHFDPRMVELFCDMESELRKIKQEWSQRERQAAESIHSAIAS